MKLKWIDILALYLSTKHDIAVSHLYQPEGNPMCTRTFMREHGIDKIYGYPVTGNEQLRLITSRLRLLGFWQGSKSRITVTPKGKEFMESLGENPKKWPLMIPIREDFTLDMENAKYFE